MIKEIALTLDLPLSPDCRPKDTTIKGSLRREGNISSQKSLSSFLSLSPLCSCQENHNFR